MTAGLIIAIITLGLILIFIEVLVVPGTHLLGILGGIALMTGVILIYSHYGAGAGNIAAGLTTVGLAFAVFMAFRVIQSNRMAMKGEITSKVNELQKGLYNIGDKGITASELRPNGKAIFNENRIDVYSTGDYIERGTPVEIIKITNDKIFVQPLKS